MHKIGIYYNQSSKGINDIMSSPELEKIEQEIMMQKKSEVEAAFLQTYGVPGAFKFMVVHSDPNKIWNGGHHYGARVIFRIIPDDKRTYAILKAHPGWLNQFIKA